MDWKWTESLKERAVIKRECYGGATSLINENLHFMGFFSFLFERISLILEEKQKED